MTMTSICITAYKQSFSNIFSGWLTIWLRSLGALVPHLNAFFLSTGGSQMSPFTFALRLFLNALYRPQEQ